MNISMNFEIHRLNDEFQNLKKFFFLDRKTTLWCKLFEYLFDKYIVGSPFDTGRNI